ncbi:MAG TPA: alpha/beta hydrolase [Candidatus Saccharibacteria bacterium]|nr:alpha/beta hydrolase [Candidatus Saccharibacteria bacterium]
MSKTLYIIHGWTYSIEPWTATVSILRTKGINVHQLRVPGLTAKSSDVWDIDGYVEWLRSELEGMENPIVLGHSNGGRILLNYLKAYPGSFEKLILLNAAGINVSNEKISMKRRVFRIAAKILKPLKYIPLVRKVVYRLIGGSDYDRAPANMKKTLHNMLESDKNLDLTDIQTLTAVLWGKDDPITPLAQGNKMAHDLPNATIREFDGWAHAPYITHPVELAEAIMQELEA